MYVYIFTLLIQGSCSLEPKYLFFALVFKRTLTFALCLGHVIYCLMFIYLQMIFTQIILIIIMSVVCFSKRLYSRRNGFMSIIFTLRMFVRTVQCVMLLLLPPSTLYRTTGAVLLPPSIGDAANGSRRAMWQRRAGAHFL